MTGLEFVAFAIAAYWFGLAVGMWIDRPLRRRLRADNDRLYDTNRDLRRRLTRAMAERRAPVIELRTRLRRQP